MSGMLATGVRLRTSAGEEVAVERFIGAGGQGEAYCVRHGRVDKALKWNYSSSATDTQRAIVEELIARQSDDDRVLRPQALVDGERGGCGYLMALRPQTLEGLPGRFTC